ncbi:MAG: hypothetical protein JW839_06180 [Candidatus Lokiarchaeota archaeon]|nr:hypothetical protein [Candidatus Lokiarchaeota archaeon]
MVQRAWRNVAFACLLVIVAGTAALGFGQFSPAPFVASCMVDRQWIGTPTLAPSDGTNNFTVVDIRGNSFSAAERYLLASVDGLVNKNGTNLYLIASDIDAFWFDYINGSGMYSGHLRSFASVLDMVDHFRAYFDGIIVFDKDDPDQANMATPLCGANKSLLVDQDIYPAVKAVFDAPVTYNMTGIVADNVLADRTAKYAYAFENFYPIANQSALAYYAEDAPHHARSFFIANDIFTLWRVLYVHSAPDAGDRDPDPQDQLDLVARILDETPINIPIYGYPWPDGNNEGAAVTQISRRGKYVIANDWAFNLPFLAKMRLPAGYTLNQSRPATHPALENKVYVAGLWSDGDNIQYVYNFMKFTLWDNRQPGTVPTGWTISASCYDLMPWIMKWYYENATYSDYFVAALSGKGYMYPREMNDAMLQAYYSDVPPLLDLTDLHELHTMNIGDKAGTVASLLGDKVNIIFDGYGGDTYDFPEAYHGTPVLHSLYLTLQPNNTEEQFRNVINLKTVTLTQPVFVFFNIHCWSGSSDPLFWNKFAARLQAAGVEIVRPDALAQLAHQAHIGGAFNVVPANVMLALSMAVAIAAIAVAIRRHRS